MSEGDSNVVLAVGAATRTRSPRGELVQQAMTAAILRCTAEGISTNDANSAIIRERMMNARANMLRACDEADAAHARHDAAALSKAGERIRAALASDNILWGT